MNLVQKVRSNWNEQQEGAQKGKNWSPWASGFPSRAANQSDLQTSMSLMNVIRVQKRSPVPGWW
jgi:hypothetical protein